MTLPVPLIVAVDPLVEDPLGAGGHRAATVAGALVPATVVVDVPPEAGAALGRVDVGRGLFPRERYRKVHR